MIIIIIIIIMIIVIIIIIIIITIIIRRYNKETKFPVTPSFVLTHSSDSISSDF